MEQIPRYIKSKKNPQTIQYKHPLLKNILDVTYGCMVYQEQVLEIVRTLAGYSLGKADSMRRVISKKKADQMVIERKNFIYGSDDGDIPGCIKNGIDEQTAISIFDTTRYISVISSVNKIFGSITIWSLLTITLLDKVALPSKMHKMLRTSACFLIRPLQPYVTSRIFFNSGLY